VESVLQPLRAYEHWLAQYKRVWRGTIGTSLVNPILYVTALGVGLGTIVDQTQNTPGGVPYLDYVAPGLLAAAAMQTATAESSWPVMAAIKWSRVYHAMIATPLTERDAFVGHQLFVITRVFTSAAAYLAVIAAFGAVASWWGILTVPAAVLIGTAFSMPMAALAAAIDDDRTFVTIFRFLIVPMFLFSGTFFPITQLPLAFELAAYVTPIWHGVELCRMLTLGTIEVGRALGHAAYLLAWTLVGFELARRSYRRRLLG
jgi:lipooligosaccharide transport system permease protein